MEAYNALAAIEGANAIGQPAHKYKAPANERDFHNLPEGELDGWVEADCSKLASLKSRDVFQPTLKKHIPSGSNVVKSGWTRK
jgi:hypothetical protein